MGAPPAQRPGQPMSGVRAARRSGSAEQDRRLRRLIWAVAFGGVVATALVAVATGPRQHGPIAVTSLHGWLPLLLLLVTAACDFVEVRLRHGDETEALALFEAGVVADALLLAPGSAVLIAPLALAIASLIARRPATKTIFNLGSHAMSSAALVGLVALFSTPGGGVTWQVVIGLVLGTVAFALINAVCLALVLAVTVGVPVRESLLDSWQISAIMAVGSIGLGGVAVVVLMNAPALTPFTLLPAVAMMMAFRAKVQEAEERERSGKLLELSQVLAGRRVTDDLLSSFLDLLRETFGAGTAVIVLEGDEENPGVVVEAGEAGVRRRQLTALDAALLARVGVGGELVRSGLPDGWGRMLLAPLDAEGIRLGVLALVEPLQPPATAEGTRPRRPHPARQRARRRPAGRRSPGAARGRDEQTQGGRRLLFRRHLRS